MALLHVRTLSQSSTRSVRRRIAEIAEGIDRARRKNVVAGGENLDQQGIEGCGWSATTDAERCDVGLVTTEARSTRFRDRGCGV